MAPGTLPRRECRGLIEARSAARPVVGEWSESSVASLSLQGSCTMTCDLEPSTTSVAIGMRLPGTGREQPNQAKIEARHLYK